MGIVSITGTQAVTEGSSTTITVTRQSLKDLVSYTLYPVGDFGFQGLHHLMI